MFQHPSSSSVGMIDAGDLRSDALRQITSEQFLYLGMRRAVYLKTGTFDSKPYFMLHGADGAPIELFDTVEGAVEAINARRFDFVAVH
jgi:hypothetical protein